MKFQKRMLEMWNAAAHITNAIFTSYDLRRIAQDGKFSDECEQYSERVGRLWDATCSEKVGRGTLDALDELYRLAFILHMNYLACGGASKICEALDNLLKDAFQLQNDLGSALRRAKARRQLKY